MNLRKNFFSMPLTAGAVAGKVVPLMSIPGVGARNRNPSGIHYFQEKS